jgi:hypothetical protein
MNALWPQATKLIPTENLTNGQLLDILTSEIHMFKMRSFKAVKHIDQTNEPKHLNGHQVGIITRTVIDEDTMLAYLHRDTLIYASPYFFMLRTEMPITEEFEFRKIDLFNCSHDSLSVDVEI